MFVIGVILILAGAGSMFYANLQNTDLGSQFDALVSSGSTNPGDIFLYAGAAAVIIGLLLVVAGRKK